MRQAPVTRHPIAIFDGSRPSTTVITASLYDSTTDAEAAAIDPTVSTIQTLNYAVSGDGGGATYARRASEPTLPGKFQSADGAWWEIVADHFNVKAFGAKGDGVTDDAWAIQAAIDRALLLYRTGNDSWKVLIPPGQYVISVPLEVLIREAPNTYRYATVHIAGDALGYDVSAGGATAILPTFSDLPAIFVQQARTVRFSNFAIKGNASARVLPSYEQLLNDDVGTPWWNTGGARDNGYSPHAGIVIDAFHSTFPAGADRYPGYDDYYDGHVGGASSMVMIDNMMIECFIVGVMCSPSGLQIGDSVTVRDCNLGFNKVCVASGQSQVRGLYVENARVQGCQVFVDSIRYGVGSAPLGTISAGVVVYCKWVIMGNPGVDSATVRDLYVESTWSIGMWGYTQGGFSILFDRCHFKLIRAIDSGTLAPMEAVDAHFHCTGPATFYGGYIGFYDNTVRRWTLRNAAPVLFDGNIFLDGVPQCVDEQLVEFKSVRIKSAGAGSTYGCSKEYYYLLQVLGVYGTAKAPPGCVIYDGTTDRRWRSVTGWRTIIVESGTVPFTVPSPPDGTATFTTANHAMLRVDDYITTFTGSVYFGEQPNGGVGTLDYRKCIIGRVASIDSGTGAIGLIQVPKYFLSNNYNVYMYELPNIHLITIGTTTVASPIITGVTTILGAGTTSWIVGDHIQGTGIPAGVRIIAVAGSTITLSHNATASGTVELYDAKLVLEEGSLTAAPTTAVWGRGMYFKNSNPSKDASNMVLRGWVCTASGAPGTWEPQYTSAVSPAT